MPYPVPWHVSSQNLNFLWRALPERKLQKHHARHTVANFMSRRRGHPGGIPTRRKPPNQGGKHLSFIWRHSMRLYYAFTYLFVSLRELDHCRKCPVHRMRETSGTRKKRAPTLRCNDIIRTISGVRIVSDLAWVIGSGKRQYGKPAFLANQNSREKAYHKCYHRSFIPPTPFLPCCKIMLISAPRLRFICNIFGFVYLG